VSAELPVGITEQAGLPAASANGHRPPTGPFSCSCGQQRPGRNGWPGTPHYFASHGPDGSLDLTDTHYLPASDVAAASVLKNMCREAGYPVICGYQSGRWFTFDGSVYVPQDGLFGYRMAHWLAVSYLSVLGEMRAAAGLEKLRPFETYLRRIMSEGGQAALMRQLAHSCGVDEQNLDTGTGEITVTGGRISVVQILAERQVRLLPPDPALLVTRRTAPGLSWDPAALCPVFDGFMETSVADLAQRDWLLWRTASALFGRMPRKGFVNLIGERDSGKSTFAEALQRLGGDYAITVPVQTFLAKHSGDAGFREAELRGARLVFAQEPRPGGRYDDGYMKAITGRDRQRTAGKWEKPVQWVPQCTPFIGSNSPIRFASSDEAMLDRHEPVRFARGYDQMNPRLAGELKAELPGILNRLLEYLVRESQWGPPPLPASMAAERENLVTETEDALAFIAEQIADGVLAEAPAGTAASNCAPVDWTFRRYQDWCRYAEGVAHPLGRKDFSRVVGRRYERKRSNGWRFTGLAAGTGNPADE
jgi:hypothetical protein